MAALPNIAHEKFAHAVIEKPTITEAYKATYGVTNQSTAENNGSRLLGNAGVRNRVQEILEQKGLGTEKLIDFGEREFLRSEDKNIGFKAWRTFLELQGLLGQEQGVTVANITFNEIIVAPEPQTP